MPVSSIAQILLRLFALNWFVIGVGQALSQLLTHRVQYPSPFIYTQFIAQLFVALVVWFLAPKISRLLARGSDKNSTLEGIDERKLYTAVFLGLGLYFALSSFGNAFNWIHYFATQGAPENEFRKNDQPSYYDMSQVGLTFAAGLFLTFSCKNWARKLTRD